MLGSTTQRAVESSAPNDAGAPWYKRAWNWANTGLVDEGQIERWLGREGQASGFEKGAYDLISGLSSPVSLALTIATLPFGGEGGLLESGGAAALRGAGLAADEIAEVTKGSQILAKSIKAGKSAEEGMKAAEAAGVSRPALENGLKKLSESGLTSESLRSSGIIHQAGSALIRGAGVDAAQAERVSRGLQLLVDGGFTVQNAQSAIAASPRLFDALKDGDYENAERLGVDALGSLVFAGLGAHGVSREAGALMPGVSAKLGLSVEPTVENNLVRDNFGKYDADVTESSQAAKLWAQDMRAKYPELAKDPVALQRVMAFAQAGGDDNVMSARGDALAQSAGISSPEAALRIGAEPESVADKQFNAIEQIRQIPALNGDVHIGMTPDDVLRAGGSAAQAKALGDHLEQIETDKRNPLDLGANARFEVVDNKDHAPVVLLNEQGYALLQKIRRFKFEWGGLNIPSDSIGWLASDLRDKAKRDWNFEAARFYRDLSDAMSDARDSGRSLILAPQMGQLGSALAHEQVHDFQAGKVPDSPSAAAAIRSSLYKAATAELHNRGYFTDLVDKNGVPTSKAAKQKLVSGSWQEIGAHLATGDYLGLSPADALTLGRKYFGAYSSEDLAQLPSGHPFVGDILKSLGYERDHNANSIFDFNRARASQEDQPARRAQSFPRRIDEAGLQQAASRFSSGDAARGAEAPLSALRDSPSAQETRTSISPGMTDERLRGLIDEGHVAHAYQGDELDRLLDSYDPSKLTDKERALAAEVRDHFSDTLAKAQRAGALADGIPDYVTQLWAKDADNAAANKLTHQARMGEFSPNTPMAKERLFQNAFEGQMLGKKLAVTDPIALAANNSASFGRAIAAREALERLRDTGVRAADGRPLVALSGSGNIVQGADGENPAVVVNPFATRSIRIADNVVDGLKSTGDLDRMLADGRVVKMPAVEGQPDSYAWSPSDYKVLDHPALRDWNYVTSTSDGQPVLVKSDLLVHPDAAEYLGQRLGLDRSPIAQNGIGRAALAVNREAKGLLLSLSPFHIGQEALRAVMQGISPFGSMRFDLRTDPELRAGVEAGLTLGTPYDALQQYRDGLAGHSALLSKVPVLGKLQDSLSNFLFNDYIPGLKARGYKDLAARYAEAYPDWTPQKVAEVAADDTNARYGGLNLRRLGRSAMSQDFFRLAALAPDWLESEVRTAARAFGDEGKITRQDLVRISAYVWGAARVLNMLTTGQPHLEAPFSVAVKQQDGSEKMYSVRTLPTDMLHAMSAPGEFLSGRVSPLVRAADETYSGRDSFGRKVPPQNIAVNLLRAAAPIPFQSAISAATGARPDLTTADQVAKAAGLTVAPYRTAALSLASQLASDRSPDGPVDDAKLARHQSLVKMEDDLRTGAMQPRQLFSMVDAGTLAPADAKAAIKIAQSTRNLPGDVAALYTRASRLPAPEFLRVYDVATDSEKAALQPLLQKKRSEYLKRATSTMTPFERVADPTYQRLRAQWPAAPPW